MNNPWMSLWLSTANRTAGWWMGHTANAVRKQQRAAVTEMTKVASAPKPKRKRSSRRKRRVL